MPIAQILLASGGTPPLTYTLTPATSSTDEGASLTFTVGGTNIPNGTYYWTIQTNAGDFATTSGTVSVTSNSGVFTVTPTADATTEGAETFTVALRSGSITGTILVTSQSVTINDTSFAIGSLSINGQTRSWIYTNATSPTYGAYTYPDETSGSLHTLTGTQYVLSEAWSASATISFNLWFYPTANNKIIIGELAQTTENSNWHWSMLEIDSTNHLKGRVWEMGGVFDEPEVTSTGTVTLNAWNHVYLYFNNATSTFGMSLNNETEVTQGSVNRAIPTFAYWGIGLVDSQNMGSGARYQGKFDALVINTTLVGSTYTATKAKYYPPLSLLFGGDASPDYLTLPASSDWNLDTTWTIEFWSKSNIASTGNAGPYAVMSQGFEDGDYIDLHYLNGSLTRGSSVLCNEPTPNVWTHVALSSSSGALTVYYNGVQQYSQQANYTLSDTSLPLYIGRRVFGQHFSGRLALVRISNTAKYATTFTPTVTYGVEADTKLFLGGAVPLIDAKGHAITNTSVTTSTDFPVTS